MRLPAILVSPGGTFVVVGLATVLSQALLTLASSDQTHHHQQQQQPQRQREEVTVEVLGTVDISSGLHKNGGVDFRVEGGPRIDYQHIPSEASAASEYEAIKANVDGRTEVGDPQSKCLIFSDEFDKLDRSIWRVRVFRILFCFVLFCLRKLHGSFTAATHVYVSTSLRFAFCDLNSPIAH